MKNGKKKLLLYAVNLKVLSYLLNVCPRLIYPRALRALVPYLPYFCHMFTCPSGIGLRAEKV